MILLQTLSLSSKTRENFHPNLLFPFDSAENWYMVSPPIHSTQVSEIRLSVWKLSLSLMPQKFLPWPSLLHLRPDSSCQVFQPSLLPPTGLQVGQGWAAPPSSSKTPGNPQTSNQPAASILFSNWLPSKCAPCNIEPEICHRVNKTFTPTPIPSS